MFIEHFDQMPHAHCRFRFVGTPHFPYLSENVGLGGTIYICIHIYIYVMVNALP